ncbi:MAG: ribosome-associated translation inhibitor RaiA [Flavobacteriaceae bacterium]|nr:ribosome-associated translation inhibitor RaiA [Flavobacteriaceae bacterium]
MKVDIQSIHFDADSTLVEFINQKVGKLKIFYHGHLDLRIFLKVAKAHTFNNKVVEMKLMVNGQTLFVEHQGDSFETAIDLALDSLVAQLRKFKEKLQQQV